MSKICNVLNGVLVLIILFFFTTCRNADFIDQLSIQKKDSLANHEKQIRGVYDKNAVYTFDEYISILNKLKEDKFIVLPINEMRNYTNSKKVVVGLRHDVDANPFKALDIAKLEHKYGFKSSYYMLPSANYYGRMNYKTFKRYDFMSLLYGEIKSYGHEIGIHNDLINIMIVYGHDPLYFNSNELKYFKENNIKITGTAAHGGALNKTLSVVNYEIFQEYCLKKIVNYKGKEYELGKNTLKEYGFNYEAYFVNFNLYITDAGATSSVQSYLEKLNSSKPGDRIQILFHPEWWGK